MSKKIRRIKHRINSLLSSLDLISSSHHVDDLKMIDCLKSDKRSEDEQKSVDAIELLRNELKESTRVINFQDFGAGVCDANTEEDMITGLVTEREVKNLPVSSRKMGEIMFKIIRSFELTTCLELGTSTGISASYGVSALKLNNTGKFLTLEGSKEVAAIADQIIGKNGYDNYKVIVGRFSDTIDEVTKTSEPIDFAFIDGHHVEKATIEYFEKILNNSASKSVLIFDDINWSKGMHNAWSLIKCHKSVKSSFDIFDRGIVILDSERPNKVKHYTVKV